MLKFLQSWEYYLELNLVNSDHFPCLHNSLHCLEAIIILLFIFFPSVFHIFIASLIHILQQWSGSLLNKFLHIRHCNAFIFFFFFWRNFSMTCCSVERLSSARVILASLILFTLLDISLHFCLAGYPISSVSCLLSGFTPLFWWSTSSSDFPWKDV